jgi:hypothetical protein
MNAASETKGAGSPLAAGRSLQSARFTSGALKESRGNDSKSGNAYSWTVSGLQGPETASQGLETACSGGVR